MVSMEIILLLGRNKSSGTLWLRDLLPKSLPGARIFTYAYDSKIFASRSESNIKDYATQLLDKLDYEGDSAEA